MTNGNQEQPSGASNSAGGSDVPTSQDARPRRLNRGQGGAVAQLAAVADRIRPDLNSGNVKRKTKNIPTSVPVNVMAPPEKKLRGLKDPTFPPVGDYPPLDLSLPKPSFAHAKPGTTFGFRPQRPVDKSAELEPLTTSIPETDRPNGTHDGETQDQGINADRMDEDPRIDEQSPDEDDRMALQLLKRTSAVPHDANGNRGDALGSELAEEQPLKRRKLRRVVSSDDNDEESHRVLEVHHRKNQSIKAPNPNALRNSRVPANESFGRGDHTRLTANASGGSFVPADGSRGRSDGSRGRGNGFRVTADESGGSVVPPVLANGSRGRGRGNGPRATTNRSHGCGNGSRITAAGAATTSRIPDVDDNGHDGDVSDNSGKITTRAARNSKSHGDAKPSQLGYYRGPWVDVLVDARNNYRRMIHTGDPFPERNTENLKVAHDVLLEAVDMYCEHGGKLDESVYNTNSSGMISFIFEDGASYRGRMKNMARDIVKVHYKDSLSPVIEFDHNSDERLDIIANNVRALLDESRFLQGPRDVQGRSENFGHSAIISLLKGFYYNGKPDCLAALFPDSFITCPKACLAMACSCIVNCLHEWQAGQEFKLPFSGDQYDSVHQAIMGLIGELEQNAYHGAKLQALLKHVASSGELHIKKRGDPKAHGFKIVLD